LKKFTKTTSGKRGGLFVGKSHDDGGIPAVVVDTGQPIEVEGGEVIINKEASKKYWKELSKINQSAGNGVAIPPPMEFSKDVSTYKGGGKISISAIRQGSEMEMEHAKTIQAYKKSDVSVKEVARQIAKDHLKENPNYYKILTKLKLAKGGEVVCRSCGNNWLKHQKNVDMNVFECDKCGNNNHKFYKGGVTPNMTQSEIKAFYDSPEGKKLDAETFKEWESLVNMSTSELKTFYNSEEGKKAGLTKAKADKLGIDNGRTSARWIMKMKGISYTNWTSDMWRWAKKQINFIKRMSGNKGSLYDEDGNKTRKHTSLLIWGHNPEKFNNGGQTIDNNLNIVFSDDNFQIRNIGGADVFYKKSNGLWEIIPEKDYYKFGGKTISQTPAPKKDRIKGSETNPKNSSENSLSAKEITFSTQTINSIKSILSDHNKNSTKSVDLNTAKAVVRRGMGAYSSSYRPTISGGKPNSRVAWGLARLKAFLFKIENETSKSGKYSQDNDLIEDLGYDYEKFAKGNRISKELQGGDCYFVAGNIAMKRSFPKISAKYPISEFTGTPYVIHAEVSGQGQLSGFRYGHAWVEDDLYVYDLSNGREIVFPKQLYYAMGNVTTVSPQFYKYTFGEAVKKMVDSGHYGYWDLKTTSGL
jgi:ribosomal protein L37AE/L43A